MSAWNLEDGRGPTRLVAAVVVALAALAGGIVGRLTVTDSHTSRANCGDERRRNDQRGLRSPLARFLRRGATAERDDEALARCEARARICEAFTDHMRASHADLWPEEVPEVEQPGVWPTLLEDALFECGIATDRIDVECDGYPCVARLHLAREPDEDAFHVADDLERRLESCGALIESLGWSADDPRHTEAVSVLDLFEDECGRWVATISALAPGGPASRAAGADAVNSQWLRYQGVLLQKIADSRQEQGCD